MTQPTPEAVEVASRLIPAKAIVAVGEHCANAGVVPLGAIESNLVATVALAFIRDAIHRDGDDADAIRQALGLRWDDFLGTPRQEPARRVAGEWQEVDTP